MFKVTLQILLFTLSQSQAQQSGLFRTRTASICSQRTLAVIKGAGRNV